MINLIQTVYYDNTEWDTNITFDDGQEIDFTTDDDMRYLGYVKGDSGYAVAYKDNISVEVFSETIEYDEMIQFLEGLTM